jgi:protein-arginine kinase activator protein McsA
MLKTLLVIICDDCGQQFLYARSSEANRGPSSVDISALTAMALDKTYRWTATEDENRRYHFCPECSYAYQEFPEDAS